ncbi:MAG: hypothetical protein P1U87_03205 [Verrucomicrobiales bacterium]|nr:hypothetical protein [Verrucomicrobiales bacterium]
MRAYFFVFGLLTLFFAPVVEARVFTDDRGRQVDAELLGVNGPNVVLDRNGQTAQWPLAKLSQGDQDYVKEWLKNPPSNPKVRVNVWGREGIGSKGLFAEKSGPEIPGNIPMLKSTEEKAKYRYYDIDVSNLSQVDARDLHLSYVVYVIDATNRVVDHTGTETIESVPATGRVSTSSEAATFVRTKTTSRTFGIGILGNLTTGTTTDRAKERFAGIWVRVYGRDGELLGEAKDFHDELKRLDFRFTGSSGNGLSEIPVIESFQKLEEFFKKLPKPPGGIPPKPPFLR